MWLTRWNAISGRIHGLRSTTSLFFASLTPNGRDLSQIGSTHLVPAAKEIVEELQSFHHAFREVLPPNGRGALDDFLKTANKLCDGVSTPALARATLALASIQDALDFHLAGSEAVGRSITERAFEHLQRSIVADDRCARSGNVRSMRARRNVKNSGRFTCCYTGFGLSRSMRRENRPIWCSASRSGLRRQRGLRRPRSFSQSGNAPRGRKT